MRNGSPSFWKGCQFRSRGSCRHFAQSHARFALCLEKSGLVSSSLHGIIAALPFTSYHQELYYRACSFGAWRCCHPSCYLKIAIGPLPRRLPTTSSLAGLLRRLLRASRHLALPSHTPKLLRPRVHFLPVIGIRLWHGTRGFHRGTKTPKISGSEDA